MIKEIKQIPGFPGYYASTDGDIYSTWGYSVGAKPDARPMRKRKPSYGNGRLLISLRKNGKSKQYKVHHLILITFVGPRPKGQQACHFPDRSAMNNCLSNLRWDSSKSNQNDRRFNGTSNIGQRNGSAKLTNDQVAEVLRLRRDGLKYRELAPRFGVSRSAIEWICQGKTWKHINAYMKET